MCGESRAALSCVVPGSSRPRYPWRRASAAIDWPRRQAATHREDISGEAIAAQASVAHMPIVNGRPTGRTAGRGEARNRTQSGIPQSRKSTNPPNPLGSLASASPVPSLRCPTARGLCAWLPASGGRLFFSDWKQRSELGQPTLGLVYRHISPPRAPHTLEAPGACRAATGADQLMCVDARPYFYAGVCRWHRCVDGTRS